MTLFHFSALVFIFSYFGGLLGVITGLGGGAILIPILVLVFKVEIHQAMGASVVAAIATSSVASIEFMKHRYTNVRIAMLLESGAVVGSVVGALLVPFLPVRAIAILFGMFLLFSIISNIKRQAPKHEQRKIHPIAQKLDLCELCPVYDVPQSIGMMGVAGLLSGLLGIGSGALKVLIMDVMMGLPYKIATSTSNFMIGITAAASAGIYFQSGYINAEVCFPAIIGILFGAMTGTRVLIRAHVPILKAIFNIILFLLAIQMLYKGIKGI
jgi:uncharacterized membrane protein YfcA